MKGIVDRLWQVPAYLPYLQPTLTEGALRDVQAQLGVTLPSEYIEILRVQNGGYVHLVLPQDVRPEIAHSMIWGVGPHFPNIADHYWALDPANAEAGDWVPKQSARLIPFDGDGHWHLCLDYRNGTVPSVSYVDVELERDEQVTETFKEFLGMLRPETSRNEVGILGLSSVDEVAAALEPYLGSFEAPQSDAHGYSIRRCAVGPEKNREWAWLSPNTVPRGFVRATDKRYEELKQMLTGTALRVPEHPDIEVFIDCTGGIRERVKAGCNRAGLRIVDLEWSK